MSDLDIILKIVSIFISLLLLLQSIFFKKLTGSFLHPAALFPLAWFYFTFIPLTILFFIPISPVGVMFILVGSLAFSSSALFFDWPRLMSRNRLKLNGWPFQKNSKPFIRLLLYCVSVLSCVFLIKHMHVQGLAVTFDIGSLLKISGEHALLSGQDRLIGNIYKTPSLVFAYFASALGGYIYRSNINLSRQMSLILFSFFPSILVVILTSGKLIFFYSITFFLATMFLDKIHKSEFHLIGSINIKKSAIGLLIFLSVISFSIISRTTQSGEIEDMLPLVSYAFDTFFNYTMAQTYALSDFLSYYFKIKDGQMYDTNLLSNGAYTFNGVFNQFGYGKELPLGLYVESYNYNDRLSTNIFTGFRGIIEDFGVIGSVIFMFLFGFMSNINFYFLLKNKSIPCISSAVYCITVVYIFSFYLLSIFTSRWSFLLLALLSILFFIESHKFKIRKHKS